MRREQQREPEKSHIQNMRFGLPAGTTTTKTTMSTILQSQRCKWYELPNSKVVSGRIKNASNSQI